MTVLKVHSHIPGRIRWRSGALIDRPQAARIVSRTLCEFPGVDSAEVNPVTGSVLVNYRSKEVDPALLQVFADRAIGDALLAARQTAVAATPASSDFSGSPFGRLLQYTKQHQGQAILTTGLAFVDRLFEAAPPALLGLGVDVVTAGSGSFIARLGFKTMASRLGALGALAAVLWTLDSIMGYLHTRTSAELGLAIQRDLRNEIYRKVQSLDLQAIERRQTGEWMSLLESDVNRIAGFIEHGIDPIVTMVANGTIVFTTFMMFSPPLAAVQLLSIPAIYVVSKQLLKPIRARQAVAREKEAQLTGALYGNIAGVSTIASFTQQEREAQRIDAMAEANQEAAGETVRVGALYVPAIQMVVGASFVTTLVWGGAMVARGELGAGAYNTMGFNSLRLLVALGRLGVTIEHYQKTRVSIERILRVLSMQSSMPSGLGMLPEDKEPRDVMFEKVNFSYEADHPVLRDISMRFPAGKTVGLVGTTGAGKSTVLKLLQRFYEIGSGSIRVDGTDIRELNVDSLRRSIAVVPQEVFLFAGTVRDNIAYARPDASQAEVEEAARVADADEFIRALPNGYDTYIGERGARLSGGQKQRLAIARAILADRAILLFDEATSAVDNDTEAAIQRSLRTATAGRTTVIVAHRLSTVRHADIIYVIDDGRVREQGRHEDLVRTGGIYAGLWRVQTGELELPPGPRPKSTRRRKPN